MSTELEEVQGDRPWREGDPTAPLSIYGASKLAGEAAVREATGSHLIVRTSWVFSSKGKNFLTTIARLALQRPALRIIADQIGAPTSARSIAQAVISIISNEASRRPGIERVKRRFTELHGLVHLSNGGETSWYGFAEAIVDGVRSRGNQLTVTNIEPIGSKDFPTKASRPLNSGLDTTRLEKIAGVRTPHWLAALNIELDELAADVGRATRA